MNILRLLVAASFISYTRFFPDHYARGFIFFCVLVVTGFDCMIRLALGHSLGFGYGLWLGLLTAEAETVHREAAERNERSP